MTSIASMPWLTLRTAMIVMLSRRLQIPTTARTNVRAHRQYRFFVDSNGDAEFSRQDIIEVCLERMVLPPDTFSELTKNRKNTKNIFTGHL